MVSKVATEGGSRVLLWFTEIGGGFSGGPSLEPVCVMGERESRLLARHVEFELRFGVGDEFAADVDGDRVDRPGEAERRFVVVGDRSIPGPRRRSARRG